MKDSQLKRSNNLKSNIKIKHNSRALRKKKKKNQYRKLYKNRSGEYKKEDKRKKEAKRVIKCVVENSLIIECKFLKRTIMEKLKICKVLYNHGKLSILICNLILPSPLVSLSSTKAHTCLMNS